MMSSGDDDEWDGEKSQSLLSLVVRGMGMLDLVVVGGIWYIYSSTLSRIELRDKEEEGAFKANKPTGVRYAASTTIEECPSIANNGLFKYWPNDKIDEGKWVELCGFGAMRTLITWSRGRRRSQDNEGARAILFGLWNFYSSKPFSSEIGRIGD